MTGNNNTINGPNVAGNGDNINVFGSNNTVASTASAAGSAVLGNSNTVNATNAVAIGNGITVTGANAVAIGQGASATAANSVALGSGSVASLANTVSVGSPGNERRITNVAAGIAPTDAVNVGQISGIAAGFQSQIGSLQNEISVNQTEARAGIALAMASAGLQYDTRPGKLSVAAAIGNFKGQSGLASGLGYAVTNSFRVNASFTASPQVNYYGFTAGGSVTLN